ncbi:hypothetical protein [Streptomyces coeruleofuscus]|uniref:Uncharacterized protein n=1 Tax=Streptomyces coeruleofuscus TaxID=66879 RepID=A0ABP5WGN8_9ACTN
MHNRWKTVLQRGLDPVTIGDILTRIGAPAQLDIRPTGHSPCRDLVTESSRAGNPDAVAERQGGCAPGSKVMRRYREEDDGFKEMPCTACCNEGATEDRTDGGHPARTRRHHRRGA